MRRRFDVCRLGMVACEKYTTFLFGVSSNTNGASVNGPGSKLLSGLILKLLDHPWVTLTTFDVTVPVDSV